MYTNAIKRPIFVGIIKYLVDDLIFNLSQTTLHSTLLTNWLCIYKSNVIEANNSQLSQKADSMWKEMSTEYSIRISLFILCLSDGNDQDVCNDQLRMTDTFDEILWRWRICMLRSACVCGLHVNFACVIVQWTIKSQHILYTPCCHYSRLFSLAFSIYPLHRYI